MKYHIMKHGNNIRLKNSKFTNIFQVPETEIILRPSNENAKFLQANSKNGDIFELNLTFDEPINTNRGLYKFEFNVFMNCAEQNCFEANDYISFIVETSSLSNKQVSKLKEEVYHKYVLENVNRDFVMITGLNI